MSNEFQDVRTELEVMRGLIDLFEPLTPSTRTRVLAWLQHVMHQASSPVTGASRPTPGTTPPCPAEVDRLAERIAALARSTVPETPDDGAEPEPDKARLSWRGKHT